MPFSVETEQGRFVLSMAGAITVQHAHDLAGRLGEVTDAGVAVSVVTTNLEDVDTCILQLLRSLQKTVPQVSFDKPSEVFIRAVDRCCLRRELLGSKEVS